MRAVPVFITAGIATAPQFLDRFAERLGAELTLGGRPLAPEVAFPYGDWSRGKAAQVREFARDWWLPHGRARDAAGAKGAAWLAARAAASCPPGTPPPLLIGHSGGGVACIRAAVLLRRLGIAPYGVVQIGSPKCAVPGWLRPRTLFIRAVTASGRPADPITRLGGWGGWRRGRSGPPRWSATARAPGQTLGVRIVGGHADYFRDHAPYKQGTISNLDITLHAVQLWLADERQGGIAMIDIQKASMSYSKSDGYVGQVEFRIAGHEMPYEMTLHSSNSKEWSYGLHFLQQSGREEDILAVEDMLEEDDELFDRLVEAAENTLVK